MTMSYAKRLALGATFAAIASGCALHDQGGELAPRSAAGVRPAAKADHSTGPEWRYFGGSKRFDRYSSLALIDETNVDRLRVVWTRPSVDPSVTEAFPDLAPSPNLRGTPIMVGGVLYASNGVGLVEAFDPVTGRTLWVQPLEEQTLKAAAGQSTRGVDYWRSGDDERILSVRGEYLYALDAKTGVPKADFGENGRVNLNRRTWDEAPYFQFNGPIVVNGVVVLSGNGGGKAGGGYGDGGSTKEASPENIRGYDVRTGRQLWTFHVLPREGEVGHESWGRGSDKYYGNMGAWGPLSADEALGYVYVPLTSPTNPWYGGDRPGDNLYANSLLVLNARTGERVWHFQLVHHDVWDRDLASPPTLGDITVDGKVVKAVMQTNKTGFLFVFDRATGQPVWPIEERPVPPSTVPGEALSPTQPFPSKPPAFDRQGITEDDLIDFTPELRAEAKKIMDEWVTGPLYTPPSLVVEGGKRGTLSMPGGWGSDNWNTGAFDPETGIYYAVSMGLPGPMALRKPTDAKATIDYVVTGGGNRNAQGAAQPRSPYGIGPRGLPLLKPPYGRITALDLNKGEKLWTVANGDGPRHHEALKHLDLPPLGHVGRPVALVTKTLLFLGEASNALPGRVGIPGPSRFRAYDKGDGSVVWETELPAGTTGGPVTYAVDGRQYIVVPVGNATHGASWIALGLGE